MDISKAEKNFRLHGFSFSRFATGAEAVRYLSGQIKDTEVGMGGSKTSEQLGLYEALSRNNRVYWHWKEKGAETIAKANAAPVYICSANALSESGEIINIDGRGNRLAGTVYGDKKLYIVAGINKLCPDFHAALSRARNVACVKNCERFDKNTPCRADGKCHDCRSKERICNGLLILWAPMQGMDVEIVLIDEELGF